MAPPLNFTFREVIESSEELDTLLKSIPPEHLRLVVERMHQSFEELLMHGATTLDHSYLPMKSGHCLVCWSRRQAPRGITYSGS